MIGQEPWPLKLGMNFTWILPRVDGQVNSGEKKELCLSTGSLKETRSRAIPLPKKNLSLPRPLFLPFHPPLLFSNALRFYFRVLESESPRGTRNPFPDPFDTLEARQSLAQCRHRREQIKGFPSCRQVKKFFPLAFPLGQSNPPFPRIPTMSTR